MEKIQPFSFIIKVDEKGQITEEIDPPDRQLTIQEVQQLLQVEAQKIAQTRIAFGPQNPQ